VRNGRRRADTICANAGDAQRKLEARINDLKSLEEKAEIEAAKRGESETANLKNLVTMYEAMKPKDAARVFDRLSHDVLVPVVVQMNPRRMAEVLAAMARRRRNADRRPRRARGEDESAVAPAAEYSRPSSALPGPAHRAAANDARFER
jgi:hypothetical protein